MEYDNEEEQLEAIKEWLRKNGVPVLLGIVVVVAGTFGWRSWKAHQFEQNAQASAVYQQLAAGLERSAQAPADVESMKLVQASADQLIQSWPKTAYADYARLALARQAVVRRDYDQAIDQLARVAKQPATKALGYTASLRLARVYLETGKLDLAKTQLQTAFPEAWQGEALELKGDLLTREKDVKGATDAYQSAIGAWGDRGGAAERIQMKLNQLQAAS